MYDKLNRMLSDISLYKCNSKEDLLYKYVRERLDKSYHTYLTELDSGAEYLGRRVEKNVLKKMNNYDKKFKR